MALPELILCVEVRTRPVSQDIFLPLVSLFVNWLENYSLLVSLETVLLLFFDMTFVAKELLICNLCVFDVFRLFLGAIHTMVRLVVSAAEVNHDIFLSGRRIAPWCILLFVLERELVTVELTCVAHTLELLFLACP